MSQTLVISIPIITDVGGLVGGIIAGTFFIIILVVCILLCVCRVRIVSSFRRYRQQQSYQHLTQPYLGQQEYPMTQPQQPPPSYDAHPYSPGDSEYPPPYSNQDTGNIHEQPPPPYPGTQSTQVGLPEPQPF